MSDTLERDATRQGRKACTNCRQQKTRCDAYLDLSSPCSRCRKTNTPCVISGHFKREHKRKRISQLEKEADMLRRRLGMNSQSLSIPGTTPDNEFSQSTAEPVNGAEQNGAMNTPANQDSSHLGQALEGIQLHSDIVNDIFQLYFREYDPFMPVLDRAVSPDTYFLVSPFLFWAVIGVASRSYDKDRSLFDRISPNVIDLFLSTTRSRSNTIFDIKGLLLVLSWRFAPTSLTTDITHRLSGMMLHMAMQMGLHQPIASQDLSRCRLQNNDINLNERAEVWGHCVVVYQQSCMSIGHVPALMNTITGGVHQGGNIGQRVPSSLRLQVKLGGIVSSCCSAMVENGLQTLSADQERAMGILIKVFESQLKELEPEAKTDLEKYYLATSRLTVLTFHFYRNTESVYTAIFVNVFNAALAVLQCMHKLSIGAQWPMNAPLHICYSVLLATHILLRLFKGPLSEFSDSKKEKTAFNLGLNLLKGFSTEKTDTFSKHIVILTQLWSSEKTFTTSNDTDPTSLRVRSRLSMSCVFDHIIRWKEEFGSICSLAPSRGQEASESVDTSRRQSGGNPTPISYPENLDYDIPLDFLNGELLPEFEWNIDNNATLGTSYGSST
ncbi:hypothetical protein F5884DRAFT_442907 [Xylogone sp. PMI_703]|nr:hypothetical protein F5884DRAFT_442907 [Xylogone sp. PMI_703]